MVRTRIAFGPIRDVNSMGRAGSPRAARACRVSGARRSQAAANGSNSGWRSTVKGESPMLTSLPVSRSMYAHSAPAVCTSVARMDPIPIGYVRVYPAAGCARTQSRSRPRALSR